MHMNKVSTCKIYMYNVHVVESFFFLVKCNCGIIKNLGGPIFVEIVFTSHPPSC